jgi:transcriptional regulator with GAF, ATPase, and Fis domain
MNLNLNQPSTGDTPSPVFPGSTAADLTAEHAAKNQATFEDAGKRLLIRINPFTESGPNSHSDFNALLMDMMARFAKCAGAQLEAELQTVFRQICEFLEIERGGIWRRGSKEPESFSLEHLFPRLEKCPARSQAQTAEAGPPVSADFGADSKTHFPWITAQVLRGNRIVFSSLSQLPAEAREDKETLACLGLGAAVVVPFNVDGNVLAAVNFAMSGADRPWPAGLVERLTFVAQVVGNAMLRSVREDELQVALMEIKQLKERLEAENQYLHGEIKVTREHGDIIGRSKAIQSVLHQVEQVAPVDCSVLITGETGTGKELIARAIHRLSSRSGRPMVMVNCAALPAPLVESELFGRERGAFTGALTSEVGRFEVADGSTIFLDEIGELSMEVQVKLLRVLQEGEFQRLGSPKTRKVNLRVIAATNKDLAREVRENRFREDLYYRLRVFPIKVPTLRERIEDLPLLVSAFVEEFSSRMSKQVRRIPRKVLETLERHPWPGNIRELRNIIERGVILSPSDTLVLPNLCETGDTTIRPTSLADVERDHIVKILSDACWRVKGPYGAAKRLQVNPSTLYSRMAKLGIQRPTQDGMPT